MRRSAAVVPKAVSCALGRGARHLGRGAPGGCRVPLAGARHLGRGTSGGGTSVGGGSAIRRRRNSHRGPRAGSGCRWRVGEGPKARRPASAERPSGPRRRRRAPGCEGHRGPRLASELERPGLRPSMRGVEPRGWGPQWRLGRRFRGSHHPRWPIGRRRTRNRPPQGGTRLRRTPPARPRGVMARRRTTARYPRGGSRRRRTPLTDPLGVSWRGVRRDLGLEAGARLESLLFSMDWIALDGVGRTRGRSPGQACPARREQDLSSRGESGTGSARPDLYCALEFARSSRSSGLERKHGS